MINEQIYLNFKKAFEKELGKPLSKERENDLHSTFEALVRGSLDKETTEDAISELPGNDRITPERRLYRQPETKEYIISQEVISSLRHCKSNSFSSWLQLFFGGVLASSAGLIGSIIWFMQLNDKSPPETGMIAERMAYIFVFVLCIILTIVFFYATRKKQKTVDDICNEIEKYKIATNADGVHLKE